MARLRRSKYNTESFKQAVYQIVGDEYVVLGEYVKSASKILMRHNTCGHEWNITPNNFLSAGNRCPQCNSSSRAWTTDDYAIRVRELVGDEYTIVGNYVDYNTPVLMKHNVCGHEWNIRPAFFVGNKQNRCPECNRRAIDLDVARSRLEAAHPGRFVIIDYQVMSKPAIVRDKYCRHEYGVSIANLIKNSGYACPMCKATNAKPTLDDKRKSVEEANPNIAFKWLDKMSAEITYLACGHSIVRDKLTVRIAECQTCKKNKKLGVTYVKDTATLRQRICELAGDEYSVFGEYAGSITPTEFRHNTCGTVFVKKPAYVQTAIAAGKHPCPTCGGTKGVAKTNEQFQDDLDNKFSVGKFVVLGQYKSGLTPIMVRHECGYKYEVKPDTLLRSHKNRGDKCPACAALGLSKGEQKIKETLELLGAEYEQQYKLDGCKSSYKLRFDFAVIQDNKLVMLIEFDGEQHFVDIKHFGGKMGLKRRKTNDKIKNDYCKIHGIPLLRISYKEYEQIEDILRANMMTLKAIA